MKRDSWRKGAGDLAKQLIASSWLGGRQLPSILVAVLGLTLSVTSFQAARGWDWQQRDALFRERAMVLAAALDTHLQRVVAIVRALAQFYAASDQVSARSFERFTQPFLAPGSSIHALEWLPLVRDGERDRFEVAARDDGLADFLIRDLIAGQLRPAGRRPTYFPILRVEPHGPNASVLGFDPSSEPLRAASMERAAAAGQPIASAPLTLVQETGHQRGLAILAPAYRDPATSAPAANSDLPDSDQPLRGFAAGVVRMGDLLSEVVGRLPAWGMDLVLRDAQVQGDAGLIARHPGPDRSGATVPTAGDAGRPGAGFLARLEVAGRALELHAEPAPGAYPAARWPLVPLLVGLVTTTVLTLLVALRQQTLATLQERESRLRLFIEHAPASLAIFDREMRYLAVSERWLNDYGLQGQDIIGRSHYAVFPEIPERWRMAHRRALAGEVLEAKEDRFERADGSVQWLHWEIRPWRDSLGAVAGIGIFAEDITARKTAELELRRFRQIVETSSEVLLFIDGDLRLLVANPAYARLFGTTPERLQGRRLADLVPADELVQLAPYLQRALGGTPQSCHLQRHYPVGGVHRMDAELQPFVLDGKVTGVVLSMHDVTDAFAARAALEMHREHLEELVAARTVELQAAETQARLILDSTADGLYGVDADCRIVFVNPSACRLLGYRIEDLIGREIHEVIHHHRADGSHYSAADCPLVRAIREQRTLRADDEQFWTATGQAIPVSYAAHPMVRDGVVVGAVVSFVDMTAYKAVEAAREIALREAERLARVRSAFLANMSHEIRTPLNGVLGLAMVGHRQSAGRKIQETFEQILSAGQHLLGIVNDILDFSKIEAGKLELEHDTLDLGRLIDRVLGLVAPRADDKGLALRVVESPDLPEQCHGDALRLSQVLVNLLANAIKFTERGEVRLSVERRRDTLVLRVADTGIGMSEEQLGHLFTPFNQADGSTTRRFGGTGLGLAISHHLVGLMGGRIGVTSRLGAGSEFEVRLPLVEPSPPSPLASGIIGFLAWPADEFAAVSTALAERGVTAVAMDDRLDTPDPDLLVVAMPGQELERLLTRVPGRVPLVVAELGGHCELPERLRERVRLWEYPLRLRHLVAFMGAPESWPPLPAASPQAARRLAGYSLLGAEDNEVNRLVLGQLLEMEGAIFTCFEDGLAVLDHLERGGDGAYQILLTDIQMPGLDGYETARRCRRLYPGLPVVGLTAHAMPEERTRCLAAGMVEHISKPVDMDRLVAVVRQFARHPAAAPESDQPATLTQAERAPPRAVDTDPATPLIDLAGLQARYQDRPAFLLRLFGLLRQSHADGPDKLRAAARSGDLGSLAFMAHSIKGVSGNLMAWGVLELARTAEQAAREGRPDASDHAERLARALEELLEVRPEGLGGTDQA